MKKGMQKFWALALAAATVVSMTACGGSTAQTDGSNSSNKGGSEKDGDASTADFVYVPKYTSFGDGDSYNFEFAGGKIYYSKYIDQGEDSYTGMFVYDLVAGTEEEFVYADAPENGWRQGMAVDADGNQYVIWSVYQMDENNPDNSRNLYSLEKYDKDGNTVYNTDFTDLLAADEENSYVQDVVVDGQGRAYLTSSTVVYLFDEEGNSKGSVSTDGTWINSVVCGGDGKVVMAYYDWSASDSGYTVCEIDFDKRQLGTKYTLPGNGGGNLAAGQTTELLVNDNNTLYSFNKKDGVYEQILNWLDCDINGSYVDAVYELEDGRFMAIIRPWDTGETEIAYLTKTPASEIVQKVEITIGTMYASQELQAAVVNFNKSNEKYRVKVKQYYDPDGNMDYSDAIARMNNEITSGADCPDIIELDSSEIDTQMLVSKGILEDLAPYLEKSSVLSRDTFIESVLNGYTYDGKLISIPRTFSIATVAAKTSVVGECDRWTVEDVMKLAQQYPDAELFEYTGRSEMMNLLLTFNQDQFIDWESGTCDFNSDSFKQMLEFVAGFPAEYNWDEEKDSTPTRLANGSLLLYTDYVTDINDIQVAEAMFGEPVSYVGYPVIGDGAGCLLSASGCFGLTSKSANKDGAWEFIESYLNNKSDMFSYGLPTNKKQLEEQIAEKKKAEYAKDENGEILLDENGEPIVLGMGGFGYDDWNYTYHPVTEEEVATLMKLIDIARPVPSQNTEIMGIISEEAEAFYNGQKSVDDVAAQIQSRASMYVGENS